MNGVRYCLVGDGDGHHWLCPVERREEAVAQLAAVSAYWEDMTPSGPPPLGPDEIDWLQRIDNPSCLTFAEPREDL